MGLIHRDSDGDIQGGGMTFNILSYIRMVGFRAHSYMRQGIPRDEALELATESMNLGFSNSISASLGAAWCESAFPTVDVGQRLAAALIATRFSKETARELVMPWRCFAMRFPGVVPHANVAIILRTGSMFQLHWWGNEFGSMGEEPSMEEYADLSFVGLSHNAPPKFANLIEAQKNLDSDRNVRRLHERTTKAVGRLICGVCAELTGFDRQISAGPTKPKRRHKHRENPVPREWTFKLTRPVKVDVREQVRAYCEGKVGGKLSLQHCVTGHWKWQPCGKEKQSRKWIHVEPYWRGPEDAPIALRPHRLMGLSR